MAGRRCRLFLVVLAVSGLAACGGGGVETAAVTTTAAPTTAAATSTVTASTTTTAAPADLHPAWPVSWAALWPPDGSTAAVRAISDEGARDAEIGLDYGVEWDGGVWDRVWLGSPGPDELGVAFYFQRPEPWVVRLWGAETHGAEGFVMTEAFDPPLILDLGVLPGESPSGETTVVITSSDGWVDEGPYRLTISLVGFEAVEVAAGRFTSTAHLRLTAEEPGGFVAETDLWIDGEQALVRLAPAHIFESLELSAPWSE